MNILKFKHNDSKTIQDLKIKLAKVNKEKRAYKLKINKLDREIDEIKAQINRTYKDEKDEAKIEMLKQAIKDLQTA